MGYWASWRRVWNRINACTDTYPEFKKEDWLDKIPSYEYFKKEWYEIFDKIWGNDNDDAFWHIRYAYANLLEKRLAIVPNRNMIKYEGEKYRKQNLNRIDHPSFLICDYKADVQTQELECLSPRMIKNEPDGYSLLKAKLLEYDAGSPKMSIPRIIHQIYEDPAGPPEHLKEVAKSWKERNPEWEYRFWGKKEMRDFLETYFPQFIPVYEAYPFNVQRWDAIRYLILYHYGGLYVDMDYECIEPVDALLKGSDCCMGMEPTISAVDMIKG